MQRAFKILSKINKLKLENKLSSGEVNVVKSCLSQKDRVGRLVTFRSTLMFPFAEKNLGQRSGSSGSGQRLEGFRFSAVANLSWKNS